MKKRHQKGKVRTSTFNMPRAMFIIPLSTAFAVYIYCLLLCPTRSFSSLFYYLSLPLPSLSLPLFLFALPPFILSLPHSLSLSLLFISIPPSHLTFILDIALLPPLHRFLRPSALPANGEGIPILTPPFRRIPILTTHFR